MSDFPPMDGVPLSAVELEAIAAAPYGLGTSTVLRLLATVAQRDARIQQLAESQPAVPIRRGREREDLERAGIETVTCSKDFLLAIADDREELRRLIVPNERPATVADYLAPILIHLDGRADVEDDSKTENDEARAGCWLRDALAADQAERLRASAELVKTGAAKSGDMVLELRRRCDALLDQLGLALPEKVEAYIASLQWSEEATDDEKTLVAGNLRAFAAAIRSQSPIPVAAEAEA